MSHRSAPLKILARSSVVVQSLQFSSGNCHRLLHAKQALERVRDHPRDRPQLRHQQLRFYRCCVAGGGSGVSLGFGAGLLGTASLARLERSASASPTSVLASSSARHGGAQTRGAASCTAAWEKPGIEHGKRKESLGSPASRHCRSISTVTNMASTRGVHSEAGLPSQAKGARTSSRAFIAIGSNMGDRLGMLEQSLEEMEARGIHVLRTSSLYETAPMYVKEQDTFLNGVCEVETTLAPMELLDALQSIENDMGRVKIIDKGPRAIDLDILLYNDLVFSNERLTIPHKLMLEREFVLRPLCQLIPTRQPPSPDTTTTYSNVLAKLPLSYPRPISMTPLSPSHPNIKASQPSRKTHIMAVLNVTPDSFSDGGVHSTTDMDSLARDVREFISAGATIIDVGGESTRPSSTPVGPDEELKRIIPAIKLIKSLPEAAAAGIAISVDTYRARVAEAAVAAGADIINDISAGALDEDMLPTMARLRKTVILMHMRGTPQTMLKLTDYENNDVVAGVGKELRERVARAEAAGIRRWRIILDPGIGFAKTQAQNLALLRGGQRLKEFEGLSDLPWLVGTSRKAFIGKITGVEKASERLWGTAAAVTAAVEGGADVIRVHDVKEMAQVVKMADAIYRHDSERE